MLGLRKFKGLAEYQAGSSLIRRVLSEQGVRYWRRYAACFLMLAIAAACTASCAYLYGHVINQTYVYRNFSLIAVLAAVTFALFVVRGLTGYVYGIQIAHITNDIYADNQKLLFEKVLRQDLRYFADRPSTTIMSQISYSASAIPGTLNLLVTTVGRDLLTLLGLVAVMLYQEPITSLLCLLAGPPSLLLLRRMKHRIQAIARDQFQNATGIAQTTQESLQGMSTVKTFGLEQEMARRINQNADTFRKLANETAQISNRTTPIQEAIGGAIVALAILYLGYRVTETNTLPGGFVSMIASFLLAYEPLKRLMRVHIDLGNSLLGVKMFYELVDRPDAEPDDSEKPALSIPQGRIEFSDVQFSYREGQPIILGLSLVAKAGCVTALVGRSGSGKSTLLKLLLRLYEVDAGNILIDNQDISTVSRASVRRSIAYVSQDIYLFQGTIRENIALGVSDASEAQIVAAAKAAHVHEFISTFPNGYDTQVGEHGLQLSGGQRQRIAIARALVKQAPVILLDEPTGSLDAESESLVQAALEQLCKGRTTIVVAHRLYTVMRADLIYVMENGQVIEAGRHAELLEARKTYARNFNLYLSDAAS